MAILTAQDAKIIGESITSPLQTIIPVKSLEEATIIAKQELALDKQTIKQDKSLLDVMKSLKDSIIDLANSVKDGVGIQKEFNENSTTLEQINNTQIEKGLLPPTYIAKLEAQAEKQEEIQGLQEQLNANNEGGEGFQSELFNTIKEGIMAPIDAVKDGFNFFKDTLNEGVNVAKDTYAFGQKAFAFAKKLYAFDIKAFALKTKAFLLEKKKFMLDKLAILMNPFVVLGTAMLGLIAIFANFGPQIREGILNVITFISDGIKEAIGKLGDFLYDGFVTVVNALIGLVNKLPGVNIDLMKTTDELKEAEEKAKLSEGQNLVAAAVASGAVGGDLRLGGESVIGGDVGSALIRDVKNQKDMVASRKTQQADLFQQRAADAGMIPPVVVTNVNDNKQMNTQTNAVSVGGGVVANNDDTVTKLLNAG
jgi:hypothetical protein